MKQVIIKVDEEKGEVLYEGLSCEILQRGQISALEQAFIQIGKEKAEQIIFESVKKFAFETVQKYNMFLISFARFRRKDIGEMLIKQLPQRGMGAGKIIEWDDTNKKILIEVKNSFESYKIKTERPACIALKAIFAGAFEILFNKPCEIKETQCVAMGALICRFEMQEKTA